MHNSEYFNPLSEGETRFGWQALPAWSWSVAKGTTVRVGLIWHYPFGQPNPWAGFRPAASSSCETARGKVVLGIFGLHEQPMEGIEPLFDPTRPLVRPFVEGLHLQAKGQQGYFLGWVDWLDLLDRDKNRPERFAVQLSTAYRCPQAPGAPACSFPLQAAIYHVGGQGISVRSFSLFCGAAGAQLSWVRPMQGVERLKGGAYAVGSAYAKKPDRPFQKGWGQFYCMDWVVATGGVELRYWYGRGFSSENMGHPLYQSMRLVDDQVVHAEAVRSLLLATVYKHWRPAANVRVQAAFSPYFDLKRWQMEYSFSFDTCCDFLCWPPKSNQET